MKNDIKNCERVRYEQGTGRNVVIEPDWPNMLVDMGENKVTSFKLPKFDYAVHTWKLDIAVFINRDADMNNSCG
jgi:hypothetical protein